MPSGHEHPSRQTSGGGPGKAVRDEGASPGRQSPAVPVLPADARHRMRHLLGSDLAPPVGQGAGKRPREAEPDPAAEATKKPRTLRSLTQGGGTSASAVYDWRSPTGFVGNQPKDGECTDVEELGRRRVIRPVGPGEEGGENGLSQALVDMLEAHGMDADSDWVKGHLENDNLGGPGTSANLTPLTRKANGSYLGKVEAPVKKAIERLRQLKEGKTVKGLEEVEEIKILFDVEVSPELMFPDSEVDCEKSIREYIKIDVRYHCPELSETTKEILNGLFELTKLPLPELPPRGIRMNPVTGEFTPQWTPNPKGARF